MNPPNQNGILEPKNKGFNKTETYPLVRGDTRYLRPCEYKQILSVIPKTDYRTMLNTLTFTGMRYIECQRFQKNPQWFDGDFIHLPQEAERKVADKPRKSKFDKLTGFTPEQIEVLKQTFKSQNRKSKRHLGRDIRLNPLGKLEVRHFLDITTKLPTSEAWRCDLQRWARFAGLNPDHITIKTTRKTWESWLLNTYPNHITEIVLSQGHTSTTALHHYMGIGFTDTDKREMLEFVDGWV